MTNKKSVWETLSAINVNEHTEKKNGLTYLSWAWAWGMLKKHYPELAGVLMYVPTQQVLVLLPFISQSSETGISGVEQVRAAPKQRVRELDKSVNAADRNGDVVADTSG